MIDKFLNAVRHDSLAIGCGGVFISVYIAERNLVPLTFDQDQRREYLPGEGVLLAGGIGVCHGAEQNGDLLGLHDHFHILVQADPGEFFDIVVNNRELKAA